MDNYYDLLILGSGPGGYVAAIRASQLGMKVAVVEKAELGGICLNWGCIPTKALLKSAQVLEYCRHLPDYGIMTDGEIKADFPAVIARSRGVADAMSKGVQYLFKKYSIEIVKGFGRLSDNETIEVLTGENEKVTLKAKNIIIATGARSKELPGMKQDGKRIIGYREAMTLPELPASMVVVGSGAIGTEFACFYRTMGVDVTLVEYLPRILPLEDEEVSRTVERSFRKMKIKMMTGASVTRVDVVENKCNLFITTSKGEETLSADVVLSAAGVVANIEDIGLDLAGVETDRGRIITDEYYRTTAKGVYAIGDVVKGPALAHVASAEAVVCVEKMAGREVDKVDYDVIPACTYSTPEVASCGMTEESAAAAGIDVITGKYMFMASGKAAAAGAREGFVKLVFKASDKTIIGGQMVGMNVTEMISSVVIAITMKATAHNIAHSIHPHPTMSEAVMEAAANALGEAIHA